MKTTIIVKQKAGRFTARIALFFLLFALTLSGLCFTACPTEAEDQGGPVIKATLPIDGSGGRHYYDLSTGEEVSPRGDNWDIAVEAHNSAFFVLTNSGDTAAALGTAASGSGGVWFTDITDFGAVTRADQKVIPAEGTEYAPYTVDVYRYTMVMAAEPVRQNLNVITYAGYPSGDGLTPETRFEYYMPGDMAIYQPYDFNKKQSYTMRSMPPNYTPTRQVYIVRHGDGVGHSKLQMSEVYLERGGSSQYVIHLQYETVE